MHDRPAPRLVLLIPLLLIAADDPPAPVEPFQALKYGVRAAIPVDWPVAVREQKEYVFVAKVPTADPDRPGACACELGLAPENLDEYRTRIDGNAKRGNRPGTLARNEVVDDAKHGRRLESLWEFRTPTGEIWRELSVRLIANRQLYTFILNADDPTWQRAKPAFDALLASVAFEPPDTGAEAAAAKPGDDAEKPANRWLQREFRFALDLPDDWKPALAPDEVALLFANAPASGIWADNLVVVGHPHQPLDLLSLQEELPDGLREVEPGCEVLFCRVVKQAGRDALETVVRTKRGPFSMTVLERRFQGERFNYEVKFTVESKRFDALAPALRKCLDSFSEVPGDVPAAGGKPA